MSGDNTDQARPRPIHLVFADANWLGRLKYVEDTIVGPGETRNRIGAGWVVAGFLAGLTVGILAGIFVYEGRLPFMW